MATTKEPGSIHHWVIHHYQQHRDEGRGVNEPGKLPHSVLPPDQEPEPTLIIRLCLTKPVQTKANCFDQPLQFTVNILTCVSLMYKLCCSEE